jgi:hypothetical protein
MKNNLLVIRRQVVSILVAFMLLSVIPAMIDRDGFASAATQGTITKSIISSYTWQAIEGGTASALRLGTSEYYLINAYADGSHHQWLYTIKVYNDNATIKQSLVDSYEYAAHTGYYGNLIKVNTNIYAVSYYRGDLNCIKTFKVYENNGTIQKSVIDTMTLTNPGSTVKYRGFIHLSKNMYVIATAHPTNSTGYLVSVYIDQYGNMPSSFNDSAPFYRKATYEQTCCRVDNNTVCVVWGDSATRDGYMATYNISATTGAITRQNASWWKFEAGQARIPNINPLGANRYAVTYYDQGIGKAEINTVNISSSGMINKSWVRKHYYDTTMGMGAVVFPINENQTYGIAYKNATITAGNGGLKTLNINSAGVIPTTNISAYQFEAWNCSNYPNPIWVNKSYYLIIYSGGNYQTVRGLACTVSIQKNWAIPTVQLIAPENQTVNLNKQPKCRIWANDSDGGTLTVNFYENSTGSWIKRQTNLTVNSAVQWNYSQASNPGTRYYWRATVSDGLSNISKTYWFTTKETTDHIPTTCVIAPKNQTVNINYKPTCKIWANDSAGGPLTINWYENSTGSWVRRQKNTSAANTVVQWNYTQAVTKLKCYWWKVTIDDNTTNVSETYYFTTRDNVSWDGGWNPGSFSYDSNGFAKSGDGLCFIYSKTSSNPDVYRAEGWGGPTSTLYEWAFILRNKQGLLQTVNMYISASSSMRAFYSTPINGHIFKPWYTEDGVTFTKCESSYNYTTNTFTYWFTPNSQYCKVSIFFPWNYAMNQAFAALYGGPSYAKVSTIATSPKGRSVKMIEFSNDFTTEVGKQHVVMIARQHAVESMDSGCIEGLVRHIAETASLRQNVHWYIIPAMDVDGIASNGDGRNFQTWNKSIVQEVVAVREYFNQIDADYGVEVFFDWHSLGSGLSSHTLCRDSAALVLGNLIYNEVPRYFPYISSYGNATAFGYAYLNWGSMAFTPEVSQADWSYTHSGLKEDGAKFADVIVDYIT